MAATNCLNFGNPEHPEVMWQFSEVVDGISDACSKFGTPITGGNVSFYNETFEEDIYPTPVIGLVGLVDDVDLVMRASFRSAGDRIILIEPVKHSEDVDLDEEVALQRLVLGLIRDKLIVSAHDLSEGGFAVALAECCFSVAGSDRIGATVRAPSRLEVVRDLFGEFPTRVLVSAPTDEAVCERVRAEGFEAHQIGEVGGERFVVQYEGAPAIDVSIDQIEQVWRHALSDLMENR